MSPAVPLFPFSALAFLVAQSHKHMGPWVLLKAQLSMTMTWHHHVMEFKWVIKTTTVLHLIDHTISYMVPRRALATWLLWRGGRSLLFDLSPVSACQHCPVWIPTGGTPSSSRMRLMGFLTSLWFPQILISICQPKKGLTYIMLTPFWNSFEQWKRQWSWLQKRRSLCWVWFGSNFQLNSSKIQIFFCAFFSFK